MDRASLPARAPGQIALAHHRAEQPVAATLPGVHDGDHRLDDPSNAASGLHAGGMTPEQATSLMRTE